MTDFPDLKIKALVSFPATVKDGVGVDVVKQNGIYQFNLAFDDFAPPVQGIPPTTFPQLNALLWNAATQAYWLTPISLFGAPGGIPDAPSDGALYGRQSAVWEPIVGGVPGNQPPQMDGAGAVGVSTLFAREDHQHPTDTSLATKAYVDAADATKAPLFSPALTGVPTAPTAGPAVNNAQLATTAYVNNAVGAAGGGVFPSGANPAMDGVASPGISALYARGDHVHPGDTAKADKSYVDSQDALKAPLASPVFTGDPHAPTPAVGDNDNSIATTAFVASEAVRYDSAQALTGETPPYGTTVTQRAQARQNVYAAPFDAMAFSGMQINGSMDVSQELGTTGGTVTATLSSVRPIDGWISWVIQAAGAVNLTVSQLTGVALPAGMQNGLKAQINNSNFTAATAADGIYLRHAIEGYRVARLGWGSSANAFPISYAMWFFAGISGTIFVRLSGGTPPKIWYQEHVVVAGWNWLTATIPGETASVWTVNNTVGIYFDIVLGGKETTPAVAGSWTTVTPSKLQTTNSTNLMGSSGNQVIVTGLVILPGIELPSQARSALIMRPYDQELLTCKRYYEIDNGMGVLWSGAATSGVTYYAIGRFSVEKRAQPTTVALTSITANGFPAVSGTVGLSGPWSFYESRVANATALGGVFQSTWKADARL